MNTQVMEKPLTPIAEYNAIAAALAELRKKYEGVLFDVSTKEGMATAIKGRAELRKYRLDLEKVRVEIKAPALKRTQEIDSEAKRIRESLEALEIPIDDQIEKKRREEERARAFAADTEEAIVSLRKRIEGSKVHAGIAAAIDKYLKVKS